MNTGRNANLCSRIDGLVVLLLAAACSVSERDGYTYGEGDPRAGGSSSRGGSNAAPAGGSAGSGGASGAGTPAGAPGSGGSGGPLASGGVMATAAGGTAGAPSTGTGGTSSGGATALGGSANGFGGATASGGAAGGTAGNGNGGVAGNNAGGVAGSDLCGQQLLRNAGFEQGNGDWLLQSNFPGITAIVRSNDPMLQAEGVVPKAGDYLAWLGGIPDNKFDSYYVSISQVIHLPPGTSSLTLSGFVRIKTEEPDVAQTFDRGFIQLEYADDRPDLLWLPVEWNVAQANSDWVQFSAVKMDTAQIAGQEVMLRAQAETDPNLKTSFWLDSLSLIAKCGR